MEKKAYKILLSTLTASSLILAVTTAFYYTQYEQLRRASTGLWFFGHSGSQPSPASAEVPQVLITYPPGFQEYAGAILKICDIALSKYQKVFGMSSPNIHVFIYSDAERLSLGTTAWNYRIYNHLRSIDDFKPPTMGGAHHVYGFIHEIGHIMFNTDNSTFDEGWAHYAASFRIVREVYRELGDDIWPTPYNYSNTEGEDRFLRQMNDPSLRKPGNIFAAGKILYTIDQKHGPAIFKQAKDKMHPTYVGMYDYPIYSLEEFKNVLVELTDDPSLLELFSENGF